MRCGYSRPSCLVDLTPKYSPSSSRLRQKTLSAAASPPGTPKSALSGVIKLHLDDCRTFVLVESRIEELAVEPRAQVARLPGGSARGFVVAHTIERALGTVAAVMLVRRALGGRSAC